MDSKFGKDLGRYTNVIKSLGIPNMILFIRKPKFVFGVSYYRYRGRDIQKNDIVVYHNKWHQFFFFR